MNINIEKKQLNTNKAPKWIPRWSIKPINKIRKMVGVQPFVFELEDRWKVRSQKSIKSKFNDEAIDELSKAVVDEIEQTKH